MGHILVDGRVVDVPDRPSVSNRVLTEAHRGGEFVVLFMHDNGTDIRTVARILVSSREIAGFVKTIVAAAETLGVDWKGIELEDRPPQSGEVN